MAPTGDQQSGVDYGNGSYLNYLWRCAMGTGTAALTDSDAHCPGDWQRQMQWRLDSLWRSDRQAKKRARRRERTESARAAAAKEMQLIEQARLENQATAKAAKAAATIQRHVRWRLGRVGLDPARCSAPGGLGLCGRLRGGNEPEPEPGPEPEPEPEPCPGGTEGGTEEGTPPMDAAIAERAAALTRESGQHGDGTGISLAGILYALEHILADRDQITAETTTSSLFKAHVLPATMPPGWMQSWPELIDRRNSWYTHHYIDDSTGEERRKPDGSPDPPPSTYSLCARMKADPSTAHFIGRPTHFVSHAHTYKALELFGALQNFASTLPPDEAARVFFWIDGFSIDEHQGFYGDKGEDNSEQWANTFKEAVQKMGNTVMVLAPWDDPVVLTRMWCLVRGNHDACACCRLRSLVPRVASGPVSTAACPGSILLRLLFCACAMHPSFVWFSTGRSSLRARWCYVRTCLVVGDVLHHRHGVRLPCLPRRGARASSGEGSG